MTVLRFGITQEASGKVTVMDKKKKKRRKESSSGVPIKRRSSGSGRYRVLVLIASSSGHKIDPSKLAKVERETFGGEEVGGTGKIETITKVEVKSKASGIVKKALCRLWRQSEEGPGLAVNLIREEIQARVRSGRGRSWRLRRPA